MFQKHFSYIEFEKNPTRWKFIIRVMNLFNVALENVKLQKQLAFSLSLGQKWLSNRWTQPHPTCSLLLHSLQAKGFNLRVVEGKKIIILFYDT